MYEVWKSHNLKDDLIAGFATTGMFPYQPDRIIAKAYEEPVVPPIPSERPENVDLLLDYSVLL